MALISIILGWLSTHLSAWLTPLCALIIGAFAAHNITSAKAAKQVGEAQQKADEAQRQAINAQADAAVAKAETQAVKNATKADQSAAAIPDDKLDDEGKSRGLLRD